MDNFHERIQSFEAKYALDQEKRFNLEAKACKRLGLEIAKDLGHADDAEAYAMSLVAENLIEPGFQDIIAKVHADCEKAGVEKMSDHLLNTMLFKYMEEAAEEEQAA